MNIAGDPLLFCILSTSWYPKSVSKLLTHSDHRLRLLALLGFVSLYVFPCSNDFSAACFVIACIRLSAYFSIDLRYFLNQAGSTVVFFIFLALLLRLLYSNNLSYDFCLFTTFRPSRLVLRRAYALRAASSVYIPDVVFLLNLLWHFYLILHFVVLISRPTLSILSLEFSEFFSLLL